MQALDALLSQATQDGTVPGAVICVAHRGTVRWHQAYGMAALLPTPRPMHCQTLFDVASLTKVLATTTLLLLAQQQQRCSLDAAMQTFYPQTAGRPFGRVTVRQLLAHTGGLPAWMPLYKHLCTAALTAREGRSARARRQYAVELILQQPLAYTPGAQTVYSDLGFIVLADILERQFQQSLDSMFGQYMAQPLGLQSMGYRPVDASSQPREVGALYAATEACPWRQRVLVGEVHDENAWAMGGVAGHAGLFATALDIWRLVHAMLEAAAGRQAWLAAALLQSSWQRHTEPAGTTRALGWDTPTPGRSSSGDYFSPDSVGHLGFTGCSLWMDLRRQVTVILCTNRVHPARNATGITRLRPAVHNHIMRALGVAST